MNRVTVFFCGEFRPLHAESDSMPDAIRALKSRVSCPEIRATIDKLNRSVSRQRKAGINVTSASHHGHGHGVALAYHGVALAYYARDPWLDSVTETLPAHPSIKY